MLWFECGVGGPPTELRADAMLFLAMLGSCETVSPCEDLSVFDPSSTVGSSVVEGFSLSSPLSGRKNLFMLPQRLMFCTRGSISENLGHFLVAGMVAVYTCLKPSDTLVETELGLLYDLRVRFKNSRLPGALAVRPRTDFMPVIEVQAEVDQVALCNQRGRTLSFKI